MQTSTKAHKVPEVISAGDVYTLGEFQRRMQLGVHAMRECRRAGLPVKRIGRRAYIVADQALEFFSKAGS